MNLTRLGGYALCVSALINFLQAAWYNLGGDDLVPVEVAGLVGSILLIAGLLACLPAFPEMQPRTGPIGQLGLALMEASALVSLALNLYFIVGGSGIADTVPLAGALLGLAGSLLVGLVTIRTGIFPVWAGWLLIAGGLLNFAGGLTGSGMLASLVGFTSVLAISSALMGFGLHLVRAHQLTIQKTKAAAS